jgi:hypothetical protein
LGKGNAQGEEAAEEEIEEEVGKEEGQEVTCRSGCPTPGQHDSWGECARAAGLRIGWCQSAAGKDLSKTKAWNAELDAFESAARSGIVPDGTQLKQTRFAEEMSSVTGIPYGTAQWRKHLEQRTLEKAA